MEQTLEMEGDWRAKHQKRREAVRTVPRSSDLASGSTDCGCFSLTVRNAGWLVGIPYKFLPLKK